MKRTVVVEDVTIFASHGHSQRSHSGHLRIVLVMEPLLVTQVLPVTKRP